MVARTVKVAVLEVALSSIRVTKIVPVAVAPEGTTAVIEELDQAETVELVPLIVIVPVAVPR